MREPSAVCRGWWGRCLGLAVAVAVLAAGCSGNSSNGGQSTGSGGHAAAATTLAPLVQPASRCAAPDAKATLLRFPAADGTQLDGVLVGSGPAGVVLLHPVPADLCGFWPYAVYLSKRGLQALAIDLRCFGLSACPQADDAKSRVVDDVVGAVAAPRAHGAKRIALVGASMGATTALLAGAALRPPVAAVVSLSTGKFDLATLLGGSTPLDTCSAAKRLSVPVLFAVARNDRGVPVAQVQALYRMTPAKDKQLVVLGGASGGRHGWDLGDGVHGADFTPFAAKVAGFVIAHTAAR
jgi:pimeloyl-ACP methyl ester carboxylesterase